MARESAYLDNIYSVDGGEEMRRYYDDWATSYDADLVDNDYRTLRAALKRWPVI